MTGGAWTNMEIAGSKIRRECDYRCEACLGNKLFFVNLWNCTGDTRVTFGIYYAIAMSWYFLREGITSWEEIIYHFKADVSTNHNSFLRMITQCNTLTSTFYQNLFKSYDNFLVSLLDYHFILRLQTLFQAIKKQKQHSFEKKRFFKNLKFFQKINTRDLEKLTLKKLKLRKLTLNYLN